LDAMSTGLRQMKENVSSPRRLRMFVSPFPD